MQEFQMICSFTDCSLVFMKHALDYCNWNVVLKYASYVQMLPSCWQQLMDFAIAGCYTESMECEGWKDPQRHRMKEGRCVWVCVCVSLVLARPGEAPPSLSMQHCPAENIVMFLSGIWRGIENVTVCQC